MGFFQTKGLVYDFGQKFEIFLSFYFWQNQPANVFDDILERKKAFLDSRIRKLKKSKNQDFYKRVSPWFW